MSTISKPSHWTVGASTKDGFEVARVREFFAVLKKKTDEGTTWETELITGKRLKAKTSAEAGEKGRAYRDEQKAKGVKVTRTAKATAKAPAKAPAKKTAPAKKAPARKPRAKKA